MISSPRSRGKVNLALAFPLAAALCLGGAVALYPAPQRPSAEPSPQQSAEDAYSAQLQCSIADGFTLAAVGDMIVSTPVSSYAQPEFQAALKIIRDADVGFANFEGTAIDIRHFPGYPAAQSGGGWIADLPTVPADVKKMGFDIVNRANNHSTDWGVEGMLETDHLLDEAGLVHAGTGKDLADARAPQYLATPQGLVSLVGMTSTFTAIEPAQDPFGVVPGRPGANTLRTTRWTLVTPDMMQALAKLRDQVQPQSSTSRRSGDTPKQLVVLGNHFRLSDHPGESFEMNPEDLAGIIQNIRQGKELSNFEIVTIHSHEPGNGSDAPADFMPVLAHEAIDNGADVFIGHGPHQLRGIEIYKGKPIFYSLGNFFFEEHEQLVLPPDLYDRYGVKPGSRVPAEFQDSRVTREFGGAQYWTSVIALSRYEHGRVAEIRLYPVDLHASKFWNVEGVPRLASPDVARQVLEKLQQLSQPFGTTIQIQGSVGIIRPAY